MMGILLVYFGFALAVFVFSAAQGKAARDAFRSYEGFCWVVGALILWPVTLCLEVWSAFDQWRFERELRKD